jgi:hypothetical protein
MGSPFHGWVQIALRIAASCFRYEVCSCGTAIKEGSVTRVLMRGATMADCAGTMRSAHPCFLRRGET